MDDPTERRRIDPENRYPTEGLSEVERRALIVLERLPGATVDSTRDVIELSWGGEAGVVAVVTADGLELRLPTIEWTGGSHGPVAASKLWRRRGWDTLAHDEVGRLIQAALKARRRQFRRCRYCGVSFPPEHRFQPDVCHGCAERHLGVVF